ncbi:MAG TPA: glycosyltransferase [Opitutaceae bacterium]
MAVESTAVFLVQRIGPYHHARLEAFAGGRPGAVHAIEFRVADAVYAWEPVGDEGHYSRYKSASRRELCDLLDTINPDAVVCTGYFDPEIHQAMLWAIGRKKALVVCSDSTREDEIRRWSKEAFKRRVVSVFGAALVSGSRAEQYMESLGIERKRQFRGWDVVDNDFFAERTDQVRSEGRLASRALPVAGPYFLCVSRFVAKKNLGFLIKAYESYLTRSAAAGWPLLICGSGPLEQEIMKLISASGLGERIKLCGFLQYQDLPLYFGFAGAVILPSLSDQWGLVVNEAMAAAVPVLVSSQCGCSPDLVRNGENGYIFGPRNPEELAGRMADIQGMDDARRVAMGRRSREIVSDYSPRAFAEGLERAIGCAGAGRTIRASWIARAVLTRMAMRPIPQP